MAKITTITNPLTGQPAQVDQLDHTAQQIDDGIGFESTDYPGCYYRMVGGVVEWLNPPMQVGGIDADGNPINEYRTTERYMGKPVYVKLVNFGALPNNGTRSIDYSKDTSCRLIEAKGNLENGTGSIIPGALGTSTEQFINVGGNRQSVWVTTYRDYSAQKAYIRVKYYKTTD